MDRIVRDNLQRNDRANLLYTSDRNPQKAFNLYVETMVDNTNRPLREVLELAIIKDYGRDLGVSYTGDYV